ncbi:MBL fold metallo-hydrolase [Lentilitoribacter sp. EG35]|uniref:MBL fold metallo-hydrolase n=1 Tax=Lentilitoribacter sp. EG35 TaxID=3234192 RepID=UPI00345FA872
MSTTMPNFFTTSILPVSERLVLKGGAKRPIPVRVRVGYFHHPRFGHTLIDTGYSRYVTHPEKSDLLLAAYRLIVKPKILNKTPLKTGLAQIGIDKNEVETVILTHFHADHIGGLLDLPNVKILCSRWAWNSFLEKGKIRNALNGVFSILMSDDFEGRVAFFEDTFVSPAPLGLGDGFDIAGDGSIISVDLPGHMEGHVGICFPKLPKPFLYAADTQWLLQAIEEDLCPGLPARLVYQDARAAKQSVTKVKNFMEQGGDVMLCHDPHLHPLDIDGEFAV